MNKNEAIAVLEQEMETFRNEPYEQLVTRMSADTLAYERIGPSGATYQIEIQVIWDQERGGNVMVMGSIDDDGWGAFVPIGSSFIKAPDGSFVGE
jgi:hypothetical protein